MGPWAPARLAVEPASGRARPGQRRLRHAGQDLQGLTDELLEWQTRELLAREVRRDDWTVQVRPELVVEIAFNDVQESPHYPGGLALRFARVKGYRPDKSHADADTIETVRRIYEESLS